jgi:hypothetical protein
MDIKEILLYIDKRMGELKPNGFSDKITDIWVCNELLVLKKKILNETL